MVAKLFCALAGVLLEGPVWDQRRNELLLVDIVQCLLHRVDSSGKHVRSYRFKQPVGAVMLTQDKDWVVLALGQGYFYFNLKTEQLREFVPVVEERKNHRLNDCRVVGNYLLGGSVFGQDQLASASFYMVDADGEVTRLFGGVRISNGFVHLADANKVSYVDSLAETTGFQVFDFDPATPPTWVSSPQVVPVDLKSAASCKLQPVLDGTALDAKGRCWTAINGESDGEGIRVLNPLSGQQIDAVEVPTAEVTSCCHGPGGTLFVTTANERHIDEGLDLCPNGGHVYLIEGTGVGDAPVSYFPAKL